MLIVSSLLESINFLTIFKLNLRRKNKAEGGSGRNNGDDTAAVKLKASIKYFPLAGLFIGAVLILSFYCFNRFLTIQSSVLISILVLFIITGGLHFDGLSDTADGLLAYLKSDDKLRFYNAMKDVNTGIAGIVAVVFYVLIIWSVIGGLNFKFACLALLTFPVVGRYSIVLVSYFSDTPENFRGIGTVFTEGTGFASFIAASIFTVGIVYVFFNLAGIFSLLVSVFFILSAVFYFAKKIGGVNGDMLGFSAKISEIVYVIAAFGFYKILY